MRRREFLAGAVAFATPKIAKSATATLKLGVLTDAAGPYSDMAGPGSVGAVRLAVEDFAKIRPEIAVEVIMGDFQLKPDLAMSIVRSWFDVEGVDVVLDVPSSAAALAISNLVRSNDKVALFSGPVTSELTNAACSPNHIHWMYDSYSIAAGAAGALVKEGGDRWFFIAADYAMGAAITRDASEMVVSEGGKVLGVVKHPATGAFDFSSFILQAQASGANTLGLASSGADMISLIKQISEFGLRQGGLKIAAFGAEFPVMVALGPELTNGLYVTHNFYWDRNDACRSFARRLITFIGKPVPSSLHASAYSAASHYLKTVADMGVVKAKASGAATVARMKELRTDDPILGPGFIRPDGRKMNPIFLLKGKSPLDVKYPGDLLSIVREIPAETAFRSMSANCKMDVR